MIGSRIRLGIGMMGRLPFRTVSAGFVSLALLAGCVMLSHDPPVVSMTAIEPLDSQEMELRFTVRLRVQNPNERPLTFTGTALKLYVNDQPLASGVSDRAGSVPRYGETVIDVPMSVSAFSVFRQVMSWANRTAGQSVPYRIEGKFSGGLFFSTRFTDEGVFEWPSGLSDEEGKATISP